MLDQPTRAKNVYSKFRHSETDAGDGEENPQGWSKTLPKSWRDTKLITNVKERDIADDTVKQRKLLVETTSPAALSEIRGFSDFPVPQVFSRRSRSASETRKPKARRDSNRSNSEARSVDGGSTTGGKLAAAFGSTKLVTKVKVTQDREKLAGRRALTESQTPAQLGNITSLGDFPLPTTLERFMKSSDKKPRASSAAAAADAEEGRSGGGLNLDDMYSNLPRAFKSEVLVKSKVQEDEEKITQRRRMVESMKPAELAQINSLGDIPMPSALENIFKSSDRPKPPSRKKQDMEEKRK